MYPQHQQQRPFPPGSQPHAQSNHNANPGPSHGHPPPPPLPPQMVGQANAGSFLYQQAPASGPQHQQLHLQQQHQQPFAPQYGDFAPAQMPFQVYSPAPPNMLPSGAVYYYDAAGRPLQQQQPQHAYGQAMPPPQQQQQRPYSNPPSAVSTSSSPMPSSSSSGFAPASTTAMPRSAKMPRSPPTANGARMNAFVFPQQQQQQQRRSSITSSMGSGSGISSLPAKPNFEPQNVAPAAGGMTSRPIPRSGQTQTSAGGGGIPQTSSLAQEMYGKLPPLPPAPIIPPDIADGNTRGDDDTSTTTAALREALETYRNRDEALQMRIEALCFHPAESWSSAFADDGAVTQHDADAVSSVLGVRLLRKVEALQKENDELGAILMAKMGLEDKEGDDADAGELADAHLLIEQLSTALTEAKARAEKAERALHAAVQSKSVGFS